MYRVANSELLTKAIAGKSNGESAGFHQRPLKILRKFLCFWLRRKYIEFSTHSWQPEDLLEEFLDAHDMDLKTIKVNKNEQETMAMEADPHYAFSETITIKSLEELRRMLANRFYGR